MQTIMMLYKTMCTRPLKNGNLLFSATNDQQQGSMAQYWEGRLKRKRISVKSVDFTAGKIIVFWDVIKM
jgi:hypothetical protein